MSTSAPVQDWFADNAPKSQGDWFSDNAPKSPPATDTRNAVQRGFDRLTTVTPEDEKGHSWLLNKAQEFGAGAIQGFGAPIVHPIDTLTGVVNTIAHPIDTAKAIAKDAIAHPAQAAGNIVGGAVLGEAGAAGSGAASTVVSKAADAAGVPERLYTSSLKPSTTLSPAERADAVSTGLHNEIPISPQGLKDLGDLIEKLNDKIKGTIAADPNRPIDPNAVATRADAARARFAQQVNAQPDLNAIEASRQQFLTEQGAKPGRPAIAPKPTGLVNAQGQPIMTAGTPAQAPTPAPPMAAADAQAMKQGTYSVLRGKFGEQGSAAVEAQKALARGLKEEIAKQFPEISNLNAQESKLLDLQPILERAVNRSGNHQIFGIGTPIAGAAGAALTGSGTTGAVIGAMKMVLDNPMVKSRLAIALSKGAKTPYVQAAARIAAYSSSLAHAAQTTQGASAGQSPTQ